MMQPLTNELPSGAWDAWIEVDRGALAHNVGAVRGALKPGVRLMGVVKANAYGHGAAAAAVIAAGAEMLAVTHVAEAIEIRREGVHVPILVFVPPSEEQVDLAMAHDLSLTASSANDLDLFSTGAAAVGKTVVAHLKVDTGMGRVGAIPDEVPALLKRAASLPGLRLEGIYTHFGTAMQADLSNAREQFRRFQQLLRTLEEAGLRPPLAHCANSAALLQLPESQLDMVRVGTLLYGQYPAPFLSGRLDLRPTWKMLSRIAAVKEAPAGWTVGYGAEFRTTRATRLAVVPVGYADGFALETAARSRSSIGERLKAVVKALRGPGTRTVRVEGKQAHIVGRVSMQMMTIDVTDLPQARVGSPVEIPCRRVTCNPLLPRVLTGSPEES